MPSHGEVGAPASTRAGFYSDDSALLHCRIPGIVPNVDQLTRGHASGVFLYESSLYVFSDCPYVIDGSARGRVEGV